MMCVCEFMSHWQRSEDNFVELVLSFRLYGFPGIHTQATGLMWQAHLLPLQPYLCLL